MSGRIVFTFGSFELDAADRLLRRGGDLVPLTPKALDTLLLLVQSPGHVVTKQELLDRIWPDSYVEQNNVAQNVSLLRKTLGAQDDGQPFIDTVPKRGYRFVAPVARHERAGAPPLTMAAGQSVFAHHTSVISSIGLPLLAGGTAPASVMPAVTGPEERAAGTISSFTGSTFTMPETRYAQSGDVNVAYQVIGDGPFDLVFVMGWVSHLECIWTEPSFALFLRRLASFSRVIIFDKRGTGLSDRVTAMPTLETRMDDVRAVMEAAGSSRAVLLGVSEGGPMCSLFAATYPEKTLALVMIGTYARRLRASDYPWGPTEEQQEHFYSVIQRDWGGPVGLAERAPSREHDPRFREWWSAYLRMSASPGAALTLTKMNADIDVRGVLPSVRVPSLILHRTGDRCLHVEGGRFVASRIPGARFVELPGDDHLPFVADQEALLDAIESFLGGVREQLGLDRDRQLATILSATLEAPSDRENQARARLFAFAAREVERQRGRLAAPAAALPRTPGAHSDAPQALMASFDGPARAVRCGTAIAEVARRLDLPLRIGAHTGECLFADEGVRGATVDLAHRIAAQAAPHDLLVSRAVRDLVAGSGLLFSDAGLVRPPAPEAALPLFRVDTRHLSIAVLNF